MVNNGWRELFKRRHQDMKPRVVEPLLYVRMVCSSSDILDNYCDLLESTFKENDFRVKCLMQIKAACH